MWSLPAGSSPKPAIARIASSAAKLPAMPGHRAEHAQLRAGVAILGVEGVADEAAIAGLVRLPAAEGADLRLELADRGGDERDAGGGAVVGDDRAGSRNCREPSSTRSAPSSRAATLAGVEPLGRAPRSATSGIEPRDRLAPRPRPWRGRHRRCRTGSGAGDCRASTRSSSITRSVPTPAAARYWIAGEPIPPAPMIATVAAEQLALPLAANLLEDDMAGVAVELGVGEAHRPVEPKPPAPRAVSSSSSTSAKARAQHRRRDELGDALAAHDRRTARCRD